MTEAPARLSLRIRFADGTRLGPGKADLLEAIATTGSIAAAARGMGMSYKRAWTLVETLNSGFGAPLVERARGGARGGGATVTALGHEVLETYRTIEAETTEAQSGALARLAALVGNGCGQNTESDIAE